MKKAVLILIFILIATYLIFSMLGAGDEYGAERILYRAVKTYKKIAVNPDVAPPIMTASVEFNLNIILEKYPDTKTAKIAHITLAEFYMTTEKYDHALSALDSILKKYEGDDIADQTPISPVSPPPAANQKYLNDYGFPRTCRV